MPLTKHCRTQPLNANHQNQTPAVASTTNAVIPATLAAR